MLGQGAVVQQRVRSVLALPAHLSSHTFRRASLLLVPPAFYIYVLGAPVFSGAMLLYETTPNLNILSQNVLAAWNAISPYTATGEPLWPTPGVTRRPIDEHTLINQNTAML